MLVIAIASRSALADDAAKVEKKADCQAREAAKGHDPAASELICQLRRAFQSRIRYKPDTEPVEMTVGSPPLITDDTETPGSANWEVNLVVSSMLSHNQRRFDAPLIDVNYGIGERVQLAYEVPYAIERGIKHPVSGGRTTTTERGVGDSQIGFKYRFYDDEARGLSFAVYPKIHVRTPGGRRTLSEGGTSFILPLLLTKEFARASISANLGVERSTEDDRTDYFASFGIGTRVTDRTAVLAEVAGEGLLQPDARHYMVDIGLRRKLDDKQVLLASIGRDLHAS